MVFAFANWVVQLLSPVVAQDLVVLQQVVAAIA
jgi:hypothetical protein